MSRIPNYCHHKKTGLAYITVRDASGNRKTVYLGKHGTRESKQEYARLIAELAVQPVRVSRNCPTVNEILLAFLRHAESYYRSNTSHLDTYKRAMRCVRELYGHVPANEFGPLALKAVRQQFANTGMTRYGVNMLTGKIKYIFKWAASEQLIPVEVYQALATVDGIRKGRTHLRESQPIRPVSEADVRATLPFLPQPVAAMVQVQLLTGMRPQEVCALRACEIDRSCSVWIFKPQDHKLSYRGLTRSIAIGPKAQAILEPLLTDNGFIFSPAKTAAHVLAERSAKRRTPRYPSHMKHNAKRRKGRVYADRYRTAEYRQCIEQACLRAQRAGHAVPVWKPNQLRHTFATLARKIAGLDGVQAALGHTKADTTQIYAEVNTRKAIDLAQKIG